MSLYRIRSSGLGGDAASWAASTPMPGRPVLLGDNDLDGDVDASDLFNAMMNFTSAGEVGKVWSDGDNDGDVDESDLTESIIHFTGALASVSSQASKMVFSRSLSLPFETWLPVNAFTENRLPQISLDLTFA